MTGTQHPRDDEHLARRLREIDPARRVAPLTEHRIEEILMSTTAPTASDHTPPTDLDERRDRRRLGIVAGLATAAAAAAIITAVVVTPPSPGATLALALPEGGADMMMCIPIAPEWIAESDVAFEGRVTGIEDSTVTLEVLHQYAGEEVDTVTIPQGTDELIEITIGPLQTGGTYLISATDGLVMACGFSGPSTPELKSVYEEAF
jgi:hypothetical protein